MINLKICDLEQSIFHRVEDTALSAIYGGNQTCKPSAIVKFPDGTTVVVCTDGTTVKL